MKVTLLCALASGVAALSTRRSIIFGAPVSAAALVAAPFAASASGVSLEEAAKSVAPRPCRRPRGAEARARRNAEIYRVKGPICTPTNPADCTARYNQMLDPRAGRTKEELAAMDRRDAKELSMLETMLSDVKYESTGKGK